LGLLAGGSFQTLLDDTVCHMGPAVLGLGTTSSVGSSKRVLALLGVLLLFFSNLLGVLRACTRAQSHAAMHVRAAM
jgi:hypothetical protein